MSFSDQVLLVSGCFGRPGGPQIVHFDRVMRALDSARAELPEQASLS